jgi:MerR family transcriptional regulator, thiopeptide resistance regulator
VKVSALARRHGLSRSTLLYYDRIGLLRPGGRTAGGYRDYTAGDDERLRQICLYRRTGLALAEIRGLLGGPRRELQAALEQQVFELSAQIDALRARQHLIVGLLRKPRLLERTSVMNRRTWTALLRASGFTDEDMGRWHRDFERLEPRRHQRFLEFLGLPPVEIRRIREWARRKSPTVGSRAITLS